MSSTTSLSSLSATSSTTLSSTSESSSTTLTSTSETSSGSSTTSLSSVTESSSTSESSTITLTSTSDTSSMSSTTSLSSSTVTSSTSESSSTTLTSTSATSSESSTTSRSTTTSLSSTTESSSTTVHTTSATSTSQTTSASSTTSLSSSTVTSTTSLSSTTASSSTSLTSTSQTSSATSTTTLSNTSLTITTSLSSTTGSSSTTLTSTSQTTSASSTTSLSSSTVTSTTSLSSTTGSSSTTLTSTSGTSSGSSTTSLSTLTATSSTTKSSSTTHTSSSETSSSSTTSSLSSTTATSTTTLTSTTGSSITESSSTTLTSTSETSSVSLTSTTESSTATLTSTSGTSSTSSTTSLSSSTGSSTTTLSSTTESSSTTLTTTSWTSTSSLTTTISSSTSTLSSTSETSSATSTTSLSSTTVTSSTTESSTTTLTSTSRTSSVTSTTSLSSTTGTSSTTESSSTSLSSTTGTSSTGTSTSPTSTSDTSSVTSTTSLSSTTGTSSTTESSTTTLTSTSRTSSLTSTTSLSSTTGTSSTTESSSTTLTSSSETSSVSTTTSSSSTTDTSSTTESSTATLTSTSVTSTVSTTTSLSTTTGTSSTTDSSTTTLTSTSVTSTVSTTTSLSTTTGTSSTTDSSTTTLTSSTGTSSSTTTTSLSSTTGTSSTTFSTTTSLSSTTGTSTMSIFSTTESSSTSMSTTSATSSVSTTTSLSSTTGTSSTSLSTTTESSSFTLSSTSETSSVSSTTSLSSTTVTSSTTVSHTTESISSTMSSSTSSTTSVSTTTGTSTMSERSTTTLTSTSETSSASSSTSLSSKTGSSSTTRSSTTTLTSASRTSTGSSTTSFSSTTRTSSTLSSMTGTSSTTVSHTTESISSTMSSSTSSTTSVSTTTGTSTMSESSTTTLTSTSETSSASSSTSLSSKTGSSSTTRSSTTTLTSASRTSTGSSTTSFSSTTRTSSTLSSMTGTSSTSKSSRTHSSSTSSTSSSETSSGTSTMSSTSGTGSSSTSVTSASGTTTTTLSSTTATSSTGTTSATLTRTTRSSTTLTITTWSSSTTLSSTTESSSTSTASSSVTASSGSSTSTATSVSDTTLSNTSTVSSTETLSSTTMSSTTSASNTTLSTTSETTSSSTSQTSTSTTTVQVVNTISGTMQLGALNPAAFVSDVVAATAVTDSIASLVGVAASQVSVSLSITRSITSSVQASYSITTFGGPGTTSELNSVIISALTASDVASVMQDLLTANLLSLGLDYDVTVESLSAPSVDSVTLTITLTTTTLTATETSMTITSRTTTTTSTTSSTLTTSTSSTTSTTSTSTYTTTSTTTSTSSTTSTTTTIGAVSLVVIPAELTPCNSLFVHAAMPDDTTTLTWSCVPDSSQLCANILSLIPAGAVVTTLQVSSALVSDAAASDVGLTFPLSVGLEAHGLNQHGDQSFGSTTFTFDVFSGDSMSLIKVPSITEYTLLDDYVRLGANVIFCDGALVSDSIEITWSWRRVVAGGDALWNAWTNGAGVGRTSLKMPVTELGAVADYEVTASIVGSEAGEVTFYVTVGDIPPPDAILSFPAKASRNCDFSLDASDSTDPGGSDLAFAWACSSDNSSGLAVSDAAASACSAAVANETASYVTLPGGSLETGAYLFTVTVSRADAESTAQGTVLVMNSNQPVVSFSQLAAEVSPQQPLTFSGAIVESVGCVAPSWKAWWLIAPDGTSATQLAASTATSLVELTVPSLSAAFGSYYALRLVLSNSEHTGFIEDTSSGVYVVDSTSFLIDEPPSGGSSVVFPSIGNATLTSFTFSSVNWLDDDLPLLHKFSRCLGAIGDGCDSWTTVSAYSQSQTMQNVLLSTPGTVTIKAEAKDTLGSVSAAVTEVEVIELTEDVSDSTLLAVVSSVSSFGDTFTTLAAVSAVADSSRGGNQEFTSSLLDTMLDSGALADPSREGIDASTNTLVSVVASGATVRPSLSNVHSNDTAEEVVMDVQVAAKAASLVADIAAAARGLSEGLEVGTATLLVNSVAILLNTATAEVADNGTASTGGGAVSDEQVAEQRGLSTQLQQAADAIGDAVVQGASAGETVTMNSSGLQLNVMKAESDVLATQGASVGGFTLPPMPGFAPGMRLLSGRRLTSGETVGLLNAKWHKNPFTYAGSTAPAPTSSTGVASDLSIATDGVRSFSIRLDDEEVTVSNLQDPIIIELPRHSNAERRRLLEQRKLSQGQVEATAEQVEECMYFNHTGEIWSTEGCSVVEVSGDTLLCACNHLSFFSSALGSISFLGDFVCPNVAILAPAGFVELGRGEWALQRAGLVLWALLAVHLAITLMACLSQGSWKTKPNFFMYSDDAKGYSKKTVLRKMMGAGQKHGRSRLTMLLVFLVHVVLRLKLDYDYDRLCEKSLFEMIRTLVFYKMMMTWVTASMGFSELDLRYLRHGNVVTRDQSSDSPGKRKVQVRASQTNDDDDNDGGATGEGPGKVQGADSREPSKNTSDSRQSSTRSAPSAAAGGDEAPEGPAGAEARPSGSKDSRASEGKRSLDALARPHRASARGSDNGLTNDFVAVLQAKSRALQRRRAANAVAPEADQPEGRAASSGGHVHGAAEEAVQFSREVMVIYRAVHPLYKLLLYSMTMPWVFQIVALVDAVFGSLMLSALFFGTSASPNIPECAGPDDLLGNLLRDMLVSLGSTAVGLAPVVLILSRRNRTMPRVSTEQELQKQLRLWLLKDVSTIVGGLLWFVFCLLYTMLFLANVSQRDADHWLLSLATRCLSTWLLVPLILTMLWVMLMRVFARVSGGHFIEDSISALLRAVNHDGGRAAPAALEGAAGHEGGARAAAEAPEGTSRPRPSLDEAAMAVDPPPRPPLLHEDARDRLADAGAASSLEGARTASQGVALPPVPPLGTLAESEVNFWAWVGHLRNQQAMAAGMPVAGQLPMLPSSPLSSSAVRARASALSPSGPRPASSDSAWRSHGEPMESQSVTTSVRALRGRQSLPQDTQLRELITAWRSPTALAVGLPPGDPPSPPFPLLASLGRTASPPPGRAPAGASPPRGPADDGPLSMRSAWLGAGLSVAAPPPRPREAPAPWAAGRGPPPLRPPAAWSMPPPPPGPPAQPAGASSSGQGLTGAGELQDLSPAEAACRLRQLQAPAASASAPPSPPGRQPMGALPGDVPSPG
ncbi:unnamed protein product [Prorocentrum cordatum]|uniref:Uncharacterized protein n=1 Tax=Prorocentrum cordatum TaxID=2364126 RepID=A0ABN9XL82_9DINO|nr:unnamed protein product [Polarella glacialis]